MKKVENLNQFSNLLIRLIGAGYTNIKISKIPPKKLSKMAQICSKIENQYKTSLSRGKRQYKRIRGLRNYNAISYKNLIVILATNGKESLDNGFKKFNGKLKITISDYLSIVIHKDEREKLTIRLDRDTYRYFREEFKKAIEEQNGQKYYNLRAKYLNLTKSLKWKGIGKQSKELNKLINEFKKRSKKTSKWQSLL